MPPIRRTRGLHDRFLIQPKPLEEVLKSQQNVRPKRKMVTIIVRGVGMGVLNPVKYVVPRPRLAESAKYFKQALTNGMLQSHTQTITFENEDDVSVQAFLYWLYAGDLIFENWEHVSIVDFQILLIKAWKFADMYGIQDFQNYIMVKLHAHMFEHSDEDMDFSIFHEVYEGTMRGSRLRLLFLHFTMVMTEYNISIFKLEDGGVMGISEFTTELMDMSIKGTAHQFFNDKVLNDCLVEKDDVQTDDMSEYEEESEDSDEEMSDDEE